MVVIVDGKPQGIYKGKNAEHLQRIIGIRMEEAQMKGAVEVREKPPVAEAPQSSSEPEAAAQETAKPPAENSEAGESEPVAQEASAEPAPQGQTSEPSAH